MPFLNGKILYTPQKTLFFLRSQFNLIFFAFQGNYSTKTNESRSGFLQIPMIHLQLL